MVVLALLFIEMIENILDTELQQTQINVSSYPVGYYTVALVCDGEIIDAKTLIKQ